MVYSLASPVRKMPETGEVVRSALKPIGEPYKSVALDTNKDVLVEAVVEPANEQEIADTVKVMGGEDWQLWMDALDEAGVLADNAQSVAYSYIGTDLTGQSIGTVRWARRKKIWIARRTPSTRNCRPKAARLTLRCSSRW